jgi:hypothetical protein
MSHHRNIVKSVNGLRQSARFVFLAALLLGTIVSVPELGMGADQSAQIEPQVALAALKGAWSATIVGQTGCGISAMYVTFTLNAAGHGNGTAALTTHGQCEDATTTGLNFNIVSLHANGSGKATLTCGAGCGWTLNIQVAKSGQIFNLVDIDTENPNNFIAGTAIHQ